MCSLDSDGRALLHGCWIGQKKKSRGVRVLPGLALAYIRATKQAIKAVRKAGLHSPRMVAGVTYRDRYVEEGASVVLDDDLVLHLTKRSHATAKSRSVTRRRADCALTLE